MAPIIPEDLTIEGKLVDLCPPIESNDEKMAAIYQDPVTMEHLSLIIPEGGFTVAFVKNWRELFLSQVREDRRTVTDIIRKTTGELVGKVGLREVKLDVGTADLGIVVGSQFWRGGLATEAVYLTLKHGFETLNLKQITFRTSPKNKGVYGMCAFLGLHHKEIQIEDKLIPGKVAELALFIIEATEWDQLKLKFEAKIAEKLA